MGRKLWTSLCGNALFFYNNTKDSVVSVFTICLLSLLFDY